MVLGATDLKTKQGDDLLREIVKELRTLNSRLADTNDILKSIRILTVAR